MNGAIKNIQFSNDGNVSFDELLKNIASLDSKEIVQFMYEMGKIVAHRKVNSLPQRESELLKGINQSVPLKLQKQYDELNIKLNDETISETDYQLLLKVIAKIEQKRGQKVELMIELARLRNVTLKELAQQLQTNTAIYA